MAETQFRFATPDEIPDIARLIGHSFPGPNRTPAMWQEQLRDPHFGGGAETLFVGQQGTEYVAALQIHPLRQWTGGAALPMAGIGTVAISPTHRRRGLAAKLMTQALNAARDRGDVASALYPFRTSFYQKLGYGQAGIAHQYHVPPSMLPDADERINVELISSDAGRREALAFYNTWIRTQNGQLERSERVWANLCNAQDRGLIGYRAPDGTIEGYALVTYRVEPLPRDRFLDVDELVWTTPASRRGLHAWIASTSDQWSAVVIRALPAHRLGDFISEPRLPHGTALSWNLWAPGATLLYGTMFRVLDMRAAWSARAAHVDANIAAVFNVTDTEVSDNSGSWRIAFDKGRITVERDKPADITLHMPMATLSRLFVGSISATAAQAAGLLVCDGNASLAALDAALALPEPWTFDRF